MNEKLAPEQELRVDPQREDDLEGCTGIFVRAIGTNGRWGSYDIAQLDRASLLAWIRRGNMAFLERLVASLLGHEHDG